MRGQCLDEGMIQSYLDGELSPTLMEKTAAHLAQCDDCALLLSEAQEELEMLAVALEPELSVHVPTESLRERINIAIAEAGKYESKVEKNSSIRNWFSSFVALFAFKPQYAIGFASVVVMVLVGAVFLMRTDKNLNGIAKYEWQVIEWPNWPTPEPPITPTPTPLPPKHRHKPSNGGPIGPKPELKPLEGEKSYLEAIASLKNAVEVQGDLNLRPTLRIEYERNLAVIDRAIQSTQKQARQNPKDEGAAQLLYASYQSKIDLLSAVSNQAQFSASLR
jgi:hypothetical protein